MEIVPLYFKGSFSYCLIQSFHQNLKYAQVNVPNVMEIAMTKTKKQVTMVTTQMITALEGYIMHGGGQMYKQLTVLKGRNKKQAQPLYCI